MWFFSLCVSIALALVHVYSVLTDTLEEAVQLIEAAPEETDGDSYGFNPYGLEPDWEQVHHPPNLDALVALIKNVPDGKTVRVVGSSHSWPQGAYQPDYGGQLICIDKFDSFSFNAETNEVISLIFVLEFENVLYFPN